MLRISLCNLMLELLRYEIDLQTLLFIVQIPLSVSGEEAVYLNRL